MEISRERFTAALHRSAERAGSILNPNDDDREELIDGLLANKERYGYPSCPCRLSCGKLEHDRDIVCPCIYREPDLEEYGSCYCALFVTKEWAEGTIERRVVLERRPPKKFDYMDELEE